MEIKSKSKKMLAYALLVLMLIFTLLPLLLALLASLKTNSELMTSYNVFPENFTFENYLKVFEMKKKFPTGDITFITYVNNTLEISIMCALISCLFASLLSYVISRGKMVYKKAIIGLLALTFIFGEGTIGTYMLIRVTTFLGINNKFGVALVIATMGLPVMTLIYTAFLDGISMNIDYSARLDGCSFFSTWWRIIVPLSKPALAVIFIERFCIAMRSYYLTKLMLISNTRATTLAVAISDLKGMGMGNATEYGSLLAGAVLTIIPALVIFIFFGKYLVPSISLDEK